jgi:hypothetical protein
MCKTKFEEDNFDNQILMTNKSVLKEGVSDCPPQDRSCKNEPQKQEKLEYIIGEYCCMMGFYHDYPEIPKSEVQPLIDAIQESYPQINRETIISIIDEYIV